VRRGLGNATILGALYGFAGQRTASTCSIHPVPKRASAWFNLADTTSRAWSVTLALSAPVYSQPAMSAPFFTDHDAVVNHRRIINEIAESLILGAVPF